MAMEVLGNLLQSKFASGSIGLHPLGRSPTVSHLAFADDIMIFFDGNTSSLENIAASIDTFQEISGLSMNRDKTAIFHVGLNLEEAQYLNNQGFQSGSLPIKYLGLPLQHRKLRKAEYSPLTDSIATRFNHWAVKCLSFAGRLQLIKSVIYSLVNFWCSAFAIPRGCLKAIEQLCNKFLWAGDLTKCTVAKVSWKACCLPKTEGGLGLRDFTTWNKVLNLKLIWLLLTNNGSLWVAWTKEHRLKRTTFWNAEVKQTDSWVWKFMLSLRSLARPLMACDIGNGQSASFWFDNWSEFGALIDYIGEEGPSRLGIPIVALVADVANAYGWRLPSCRTRCPSIESFRNYLLSKAPPNNERGADCFTWGPQDNRRSFFSSKRTWEIMRPSASRLPWTKVVWFSCSVPKHSFTFWISHLDRLPVKARLLNWGMSIDVNCTLCSQHVETRDHLLLHCEFSEQIWHLLLHRLGFPPLIFNDWNTLITWLLTRSGSSRTLNRIAAQATVYNIWKERNNRVHNSASFPPLTIFRHIDRTIRDILLARRHNKRCRGLLSKWFAYS
ncbi:putative ribonuclease H protein [Cardamine amara subsp. amara]|uniref:Ribonuclease H protein n=1 Tax=Cardamine amara subsp. amara TaxID=228776 RepID=A0ABD1BMB8_CARAN